MNKQYLDQLEYKVVGACIEVHKYLGPGLLESVYHQCLTREFQLQEISFISEHHIGVEYKDIQVNTLLKADFIINKCLVLEIKAVDLLLPIHHAQILTYMKLLEVPKGLLINFNCVNIIQNGKKSFVNEFYRELL